MSEQQFETVLSHQDYIKYKTDKLKYEDYQKFMNQMAQNNSQLENQVKLLKKSVFKKNAETTFLTKMIDQFIISCNQRKQQRDELQESIFQSLSPNNNKGLNSIQNYELMQSLQKSYKHTKQELQKISQLFKSTKCSIQKINQTDKNQFSELKPLQISLKQKQVLIQSLHSQKVLLLKQNELQLAQINMLNKKVQQYQFKMYGNKNKDDKTYFIKLLVQEYYRELNRQLNNMQIEKHQINIIVESQMNNIIDHINNLIRNQGKLKSKIKGNRNAIFNKN